MVDIESLCLTQYQLKKPMIEQQRFKEGSKRKCFLGVRRKYLLRKQNVSEQFRNIFASREANFGSATTVPWGSKRGNIAFRKNVSATLFPRLRAPFNTFTRTLELLTYSEILGI